MHSTGCRKRSCDRPGVESRLTLLMDCVYTALFAGSRLVSHSPERLSTALRGLGSSRHAGEGRHPAHWSEWINRFAQASGRAACVRRAARSCPALAGTTAQGLIRNCLRSANCVLEPVAPAPVCFAHPRHHRWISGERMSEPVQSLTPLGYDGDRLKVPPHSLEAEQSVLGGLLLDNNAWDQVADAGHRRGFLSPRSSADLSRHRRSDRARRALRRGHAVRMAGKPAQDWTTSAGWPISACSPTIRPAPPISGPTRRSCASIPCCGSWSASAPRSPTAPISPRARSRGVARSRRTAGVRESPNSGSSRGSGFISIKDLLGKAVDRIDTLFQQDKPDHRRPHRLHRSRRNDGRPAAADLIIVAGRPPWARPPSP